MDWSAIISAIATFGFAWALRQGSTVKTFISEIVKQETALVSQKVTDLDKDVKKINSDIDFTRKDLKEIMSSIAYLKAKSDLSEKTMESIQREFFAALKDNTEQLKDLKRSEFRQIGDHLILVKGKKDEQS